MVTIKTYNYNGKSNVISKNLGVEISTLSGLFFNNVGIINPMLEIRANAVNFNYVYIVELNKYYFVENYTITDYMRANVVLRLDVLKTYETEIKNATATITEKSGGNAFISNRFAVTDVRPIFEKINFSVDKPFNEYGDIILTTTKGNV